MRMKTILYNGIVVNDGKRFAGYVVIADALIEEVGVGVA